jgi:DNA polymerase-3 subunit beta
LPVYNFPSFVAGELAEPISIPVDVLAAGLEATRFCMAIKDVRYYLNGLAVEGGDGLTLVASDGHRLAKFQAEIAGEIPTMILPRDVVAELLRYLKGAESVALVTGRPGPNSTVNTASFLFDGGLRLYCRLIEGKYPDWRRVRPREIDRTATIDRAGLIQALGRAALFGGDYQAVSLRFQPGALTITAANQETEEAEEEIAVEWNGKPLEVGFSAKYLVEALGGLSSDTVRMGFPAEANNCVVDDPDDARLSYVVMPMRL